MNLSNLLLLILVGISIIPLLILGMICIGTYYHVMDTTGTQVSVLGNETVQESTQALIDLGEQIIKEKAYDHGKQIEIFLTAHPAMTVQDLQNSSEFQNISVQKFKKQGYVNIDDSETLVIRFHPNPKLINFDLHNYSTTLPDFWKVMSKAEGGKEASGYYPWIDPDGSVRDKFMYIHPIDVRTADGVRFCSVASDYMDEFSTPVQALQNQILEQNQNLMQSFRTTINNTIILISVIIIVALMAAIILSIYMSRKIAVPIIRISETAKSISEGQYSLILPDQSGVIEIQRLCDAFNVMSSQIEEKVESLQYQNLLFATQNEVSVDGILVVDNNGAITSYNHQFLEIWNIPEEEIDIRSLTRQFTYFIDLLTGPDEFTTKSRYLSLHPEEKSIDEIHLRDGKILDQYSAPLTGTDGKKYGRVWFYRDITTQRVLEKSLRDSEQTLRTIISGSPAAQFVIDYNHQVLYWNKALEEISGVSGEDVIGSSLHWKAFYTEPRPCLADILVDNQIELLVDWYPGIRRRSTVIASAYEGTKFFEMPYSEGKWLVFTAVAIRDSAGTIIGAVQTLEDITERKQEEAELIQYRNHLEELVKDRTSELAIAKEQAEAANNSKSVFLSNMSHELRTPLNAILGYSQILSRKEIDPDTIKGLTIIGRSGEHLLTLINDILDIAKIEAGKIVLNPVPINFQAFIDGLQSIIWTRTQEKGIGFIVEPIHPLPPGIMADETRLRQILLNLMGNAVKFTDKGQVTLRILSLTEPLPDLPPKTGQTCTIRFEIEDTGIGIHPELIDLIFIPFEQVSDVTRQIQGTGLGLAISNQLARLMGSRIQVRSTPGEGSIFWLDLTFPKIPEGTSTWKQNEEIPIGYEGNRVKILVVDDICDNRMLIADLLRPLGFEVFEAENGEEGVTCAEENRPDLILMDLRMPVMDGYEAVHKIRSLSEISQIPVFAMSASVGEDEHLRAGQEGFNGFIIKPILWSDLAGFIEKYLMITWIYQKIEKTGIVEEEEMMIPPPPEILRTLAELVQIGDIRAIINLTRTIKNSNPEYLAFSRTIRKIAEEFDLKKIKSLLNSYQTQEEGDK